MFDFLLNTDKNHVNCIWIILAYAICCFFNKQNLFAWVPSYELQFLPENKFLKTEFLTHFQKSLSLIKQEKLFYV